MIDATCTGAWIETYTGRKFHLLDPQPDEIDIKDIAHALSNQCRYAGHTRTFYSVAEHSYHVSLLVSPKHALEALLHDASEAYLSDLSRPVKYLTPIGAPYLEVEERIMSVIAAKFNFDLPMAKEVKDADNLMLLVEKERLMSGLSWSDDAASVEARRTILTTAAFVDPQLFGMSPMLAENVFMQRFDILTE